MVQTSKLSFNIVIYFIRWRQVIQSDLDVILRSDIEIRIDK